MTWGQRGSRASWRPQPVRAWRRQTEEGRLLLVRHRRCTCRPSLGCSPDGPWLLDMEGSYRLLGFNLVPSVIYIGSHRERRGNTITVNAEIRILLDMRFPGISSVKPSVNFHKNIFPDHLTSIYFLSSFFLFIMLSRNPSRIPGLSQVLSPLRGTCQIWISSIFIDLNMRS